MRCGLVLAAATSLSPVPCCILVLDPLHSAVQEYFFPREDESKARAAAAFVRSVAVPAAAAARHRRSATALPGSGMADYGSQQGSPMPPVRDLDLALIFCWCRKRSMQVRHARRRPCTDDSPVCHAMCLICVFRLLPHMPIHRPRPPAAAHC